MLPCLAYKLKLNILPRFPTLRIVSIIAASAMNLIIFSCVRELNSLTRVFMLRFTHLKVLQGFLHSQRGLFREIDDDVENHSDNFNLVLGGIHPLRPDRRVYHFPVPV